MGLFVKHAVQFNSGWLAEASSGILAGMVVAIETNASTGEIQLARADRVALNTAFTGPQTIAGIAGDDATSTGNTMVVVDPVYQVVMSKPTRRLGDYKDETITNVSNWTDSGIAKRGVTVFSVGGEFATDQYNTAYSCTAVATTDTAAAHTPAINDAYTVGGTTASAETPAVLGKLVYGAIGVLTLPSMWTLARCTGSVSNGLLPFRWVFVGA